MERSSGKALNVKASKWGDSLLSVGRFFRSTLQSVTEVMLRRHARQPQKQIDGQMAEKAAAKFLRVHEGYEIITRNWRRGNRIELDIVARDRETLVFVEVRARAAGALVNGYQSINDAKRRSVQKAGRVYLSCLQRKPMAYRFDVVEIELQKDSPSSQRTRVSALRHHKGVFR